MIHFVVVVGSTGSCAACGPRLRSAIETTTSIGGHEVHAVSPSGTWGFHAVAAPDAVLDPRWHTDGEGLVVCNGTVTGDPRAVAPAAVLERYRCGGIDAATKPLSGTYNLTCISPEQGLTISGDVAAFYPLYFGTGSGQVVIANRSTTVAAALGTSGWSTGPLGWIIGAGHICGEDVPAAGVRSLRAGHVGRVPWGRAHLTTGPPTRQLMPPPGTGEGRPDLTPSEWDAITDDLIGQVRGLAALDTPLYLQLSGGKDSRLLLSLLLGAGITDLESYTAGPPGAEVRCAELVAATAGISHRMWMPPEARHVVRREVIGDHIPDGPLAPLWRQVARGLGRFDGIVPTWAGVSTPPGAGSLMLKGWGGEVYRYKSRPAPLVDLALLLPPRPGSPLDVDVLTACLTARIDPLRVLAPAERDRQRAWLRSWVQQTVATVRPDLLPDLFYIDHRLGQIAGPVTQDIPLRVVANPLVSFVATSLYSELSLHARSTDRLHYEVMRRLAPDLAALPFVGQVWRPEIRAMATQELATAPFERSLPTPVAAPRWKRQRLPLGNSPAVRRARSAKRSAQERLAWRARVDWLAGSRWSPPPAKPHDRTFELVTQEPAAVVALLREAADAGLAEICRVDRLCGLVERPGRLTQPEELQITSSIGVAMLLVGRSERVFETPAELLG
ncbi:MAG: hypothetical protein ACXWBN_10110 [Acidimicrobiales bacterium]